jgi:AcrR family transcriptional regulator
MAKQRLSREAWLGKGLEVLAEKGFEAVRVEGLARLLGVTKGSFYWHFKDRADLRHSLLDYWVESTTVSVMDEVGALPASPPERLERLARIITETGRARFDLSFRMWALADAAVARVVRRVDERRLEFVRTLFAGCGFKGREAELRARMFVYYALGEAAALIDDPTARAAFIGPRLELLLKRD